MSDIAVILANLGAPRNLNDVRPYLKNLFMDPDIFSFPFGRTGQRFFSSVISTFRAPKSSKNYALIGGSPLQQQTEAQAKKLEQILKNYGDYRVFVAQRYWHPLFGETGEAVWKSSPREVFLLPLYPQYSTTTTQSIVNEWRRQENLPEPRIIWRFYEQEAYLNAVERKIREPLKSFDSQPLILFTAHSIPVGRIKDGDTYQSEIEHLVSLLKQRLGEMFEYRLAYQSKVGPVKWLGPSVEETLRELAFQKKHHLLIVPLSFVSENLETLYELDIEYKELAISLGISQYERAETVQDDDEFIHMLATMIIGEAYG